MACRLSEVVVDARDPEALAAWWAELLDATDRDQDAGPERLPGLGVTRADVGRTGEESRHVLADPEGDPFCLLRRRLDPH